MKELLKKLIKRRTARVFGTDDKAGKIGQIIANSFDNEYREPLAKLLSIVLDTEIVLQESKFVQFVCVVPEANKNDHNYRIGDPVIHLYNDVFYSDKFNSSGNHLDDDVVRAATPEEIDELIDKEYDNFLKYVKQGSGCQHYRIFLEIAEDLA